MLPVARFGQVTCVASALVLLALARFPVVAQERTSLPLVGWLRVAVPEAVPGNPLINALAQRGLIDGKAIRFEIQNAEGQVARMPALAENLVRDGAKVIIAFGPDATRAAMAATKSIPIVAVAAFAEEGLVDQLSRPAGNLTGVSILVNELDPKKLEVLKELLPDTTHVAVLNDGSTNIPDRPRAMTAVADKIGLKLTPVSVSAPSEFETAFQTFREAGATAVAINASTLFATLRSKIGELSLTYRLPAICQWREMVEVGCFASYGVTQKEMFDLVAAYTAQILAGTKPNELPIVQPRRFELVVNLKIAREMGLTIPPAMLSRADEVIE